MYQRIILLIAFSVIFMDSISQTFNRGELAFSLSGGSSRPMAGFSGKDIASSIIYREDVTPPWEIGIKKSENGFARPGYYYAAQVNYGITNRFFVFLRAGSSNNPVAEQIIEDYFSTLWSVEVNFTQTDYQLRTLAPGIGYSHRLGNWGLSTGLFAGNGRLEFPYYNLILTYTPSHKGTWGHDGPRPDLNAFAYGGMFNLSYETGRIQTGLEILYQRADFEYSMTTRLVPGGNFNPVYHDTIKSSLLFIGLQVSYSIIKGKPPGR
ncbi:hypothetical protein [Aquiflexum lacus]|uniref:hypothetical protein n=1 Tax=Aquiflexum lacus TaxID=2483805 RepID=UPI00189485DE|nr:hypothetical protein [Aquiflexum lacus]